MQTKRGGISHNAIGNLSYHTGTGTDLVGGGLVQRHAPRRALPEAVHVLVAVHAVPGVQAHRLEPHLERVSHRVGLRVGKRMQTGLPFLAIPPKRASEKRSVRCLVCVWGGRRRCRCLCRCPVD
jgi:hypothetical protein